MRRTFTVMAMVMALAMSTLGAAIASSTMLDPFTQPELDNNWEADRRLPTGGVESEEAFGRTDVAVLSIDGDADVSAEYEGIKTVGAQDFGLAVHVDLYLDPAWEDKAGSAGLWVVGEVVDETGASVRDDIFPVIEFINFGDGTVVETFGRGGFERSTVEFDYGTWVTLSITLDPEAEEYSYAVDGEEIRTTASDAKFIREVFLNQFNFVNDLDNDFTAYWHAGVEAMPSADDCKDGGWQTFGDFRNQGRCIASFKANANAGPHN